MIFVDTSFWVAAQNDRDDRHHEAVRLLRTNRDRALVTTNHVVGETWTFLQRRAGCRDALAFLDSVQGTSTVVREHVDAELETEALAWLRRHKERAYSFVDATSFAVMRRHGIEEAFAFDEDFSAAGFVELRA